jgi:hypothetical protein
MYIHIRDYQVHETSREDGEQNVTRSFVICTFSSYIGMKKSRRMMANDLRVMRFLKHDSLYIDCYEHDWDGMELQ